MEGKSDCYADYDMTLGGEEDFFATLSNVHGVALEEGRADDSGKVLFELDGGEKAREAIPVNCSFMEVGLNSNHSVKSMTIQPIR